MSLGKPNIVFVHVDQLHHKALSAKAQIICDTDDLNSLRHWEFKSYEVGPKGNIRSLSKLTEKGS